MRNIKFLTNDEIEGIIGGAFITGGGGRGIGTVGGGALVTDEVKIVSYEVRQLLSGVFKPGLPFTLTLPTRATL